MREIEKLTVLMPVYNSAKYLSPALKSILDQSFKEYQLLIIDDGSTDESEKIVGSYKDSRINYIRIPHEGLGAALNFGLINSQYDWIARMDADDLAHPRRLELQVDFLNSHREIDVLSCRYAMFRDRRLIFTVPSFTHHDDIRKRLALQNEITHSGVVYNRNTILENGGYSTGVFEDYDLWLRIKDRVKFNIMPLILNFVRYNPLSYSRESIETRYSELYNILQTYYGFDLSESFGIEANQEMSIRGWREYFYGNKKLARKYWKDQPGQNGNTNVEIARIATHLPEKLFIKLKESRLRLRINYLYNYFSPENINARKVFRLLVGL